ncbi:hypothetical protein E5D57_013688 [Metarhizium anisopliae]|nr:hypothetical protein E5D57_013688 [Metarhizium anisopliae]
MAAGNMIMLDPGGKAPSTALEMVDAPHQGTLPDSVIVVVTGSASLLSLDWLSAVAQTSVVDGSGPWTFEKRSRSRQSTCREDQSWRRHRGRTDYSSIPKCFRLPHIWTPSHSLGVSWTTDLH